MVSARETERVIESLRRREVKCAVDRGGPGGNEAWSRGMDTGRAECQSLTVSEYG
jgi:hypothetical protein